MLSSKKSYFYPVRNPHQRCGIISNGVYLWHNKGSILMVSLWILIILTILGVIVAGRVSSELRFVRYQRDRLKASYLAKAGINKSISLLESDLSDNETKDYDTTFECGVNLKEDEEPKDIFAEKYDDGKIGYKIGYTDKKGEFVYGMSDEERRININRTDDIVRGQCRELFLLREIDDAESLADIIVNWIDTDKETEDIFFKNKPLSCPEELLVILDYFYQQKRGYSKEKSEENSQIVFNKIKELITVYGDGRININTASEEVLIIFLLSIAKQIGQSLNQEQVYIDAANSLLAKIKDFRNNNPVIKNEQDIVMGNLSTEEANIFNNLKPKLKIKSDNFRIEAKGIINNQTMKKVVVIINRSNSPFKTLYWHEG